MVFRNNVIWIESSRVLYSSIVHRSGGRSACGNGGGRLLRIFIGLEHIQPFQLLIQDSKGLKALRLIHLNFKPILDLILSVVFQILVQVVKMPVNSKALGE